MIRTKYAEAVDTLTDLELARGTALVATDGPFFCSVKKAEAHNAYQAAAKTVNTYCDRIRQAFPADQAQAIISRASERVHGPITA